MGAFHINCIIVNPKTPAKKVALKGLLVDNGSEFTWVPSDKLLQAGITVRKKDVAFRMAKGQVITRDVGYAIIQTNGFETVDEVVFAQPGDLRLLGSRTLEGFGATVDARSKRLVAAGPQPAAAMVNYSYEQAGCGSREVVQHADVFYNANAGGEMQWPTGGYSKRNHPSIRFSN
jgi:predicted aspartyl protease